MNKKLIATAVAATFVAPAAMADISVYARINNALDIQDPDGGDTTTDLRNVSSRFGLRGEADLGNGLMAHGRYEFSTFTDREGGRFTLVDADGDGQADGSIGNSRGGINDTRIGSVGLSGEGWGRIDAGNQWSAYYNSVGTHMSPTYSLGYYLYSSVGGGPFRASNTIKYSNTFGEMVSLELDTRFSQDSTLSGADVEKIGADNGEDFLDGYGIGLTFAITPDFSLAASVDSELFDVGDDTDRVGLAFNWAFSPQHRIAGGWQNIDTGARDDDSAIVYYHGNDGGANSWSIGYGKGEEAGFDPSMLFLAAYHNFGEGFRTYFEAVALDGDSGPRGDANQLILGFRYDF